MIRVRNFHEITRGIKMIKDKLKTGKFLIVQVNHSADCFSINKFQVRRTELMASYGYS